MPDRTDIDASPSRMRFFQLAGGAGAAGVLSLALGACGDDDDDSPPATTPAVPGGGPRTDLGIVNYLLRLEHMELRFYEDALAADVLQDEKVVGALEGIRDNERDHVARLRAAAKRLGGRAARPSSTDFKRVIDEGEAKVLATAAALENLGAAAYLAQVDRIADGDLLATVVSIQTVEGRHAALLNFVAGRPITPDGPFAKPATRAEVRRGTKPFLARGRR